MPTTTHALHDAVQTLKKTASTALSRNSAEEFETFERQLNEFDAKVREVQQQLWGDRAQTTIAHLQGTDGLTTEDLELIRVFLISDAEHYLEHENNFACWTTELNRLLDGISRQSAEIDRESIQDLRGVLKDAVRLVPDIRNYLAERARVDRFNAGMKHMDKTTRQTLLKLLKEQISSVSR